MLAYESSRMYLQPNTASIGALRQYAASARGMATCVRLSAILCCVASRSKTTNQCTTKEARQHPSRHSHIYPHIRAKINKRAPFEPMMMTEIKCISNSPEVIAGHLPALQLPRPLLAPLLHGQPQPLVQLLRCQDAQQAAVDDLCLPLGSPCPGA